MPKGVIDFSYDSGKNYTKKRKRIPGANSNKSPEIKQFNPIGGGSDLTGLDIWPFVKDVTADSYAMMAWRFKPLIWPSLGTNGWSRIGTSFFLKSLRFKGYVAINHNVIRPIRWRLKLYRFENPIPDWRLSGTTYTVQTDVYLSLFKNFENFPSTVTTSGVIDKCKHNYYKMIKNMPKDRPYTSKTIASGIIPANNAKRNEGTQTLGSTTSYSFSYSMYTDENFGTGCIPVDVLVKCNDRITYSMNDDQSSLSATTQYALVLEDDWGVGVQLSEASYTQGATTPWKPTDYGIMNGSYPCYVIKLFCRGYFTDD